MISTLPAVQFSIKSAWRIIKKRARTARYAKTHANRRHRRALNRATRRFTVDPERFYDEGFNAYSLSSWDLC
jgi:hypothetical protein